MEYYHLLNPSALTSVLNDQLETLAKLDPVYLIFGDMANTYN